MTKEKYSELNTQHKHILKERSELVTWLQDHPNDFINSPLVRERMRQIDLDEETICKEMINCFENV